MVLASLQEQVNVNDANLVNKVPVAERESEMKALRRRLTGLAAGMLQLNEVRYISQIIHGAGIFTYIETP